MRCSAVGLEVWPFFFLSTVLVASFVFATRPFQRWLRARRARSAGLGLLPAFLFEESSAWLVRALGIIPVLMWAVAALGVYCFFHGAELPPPVR
jgi:hypothetical protein